MAGSSSSTKKEWLLKREAEIRCEVQENELLTLRLVAGSAEIFGVEMAPNKDYMFKDQNIAVFTWYGCTIESSGADNAIYLVDSTPMISYVNTHVQLQAKRDVALNNSDYGPRVMIVGPTDHGKSTLAQLLSVYAVRMDRSPIYVDLDVGQSALSIPGCISAAQLGKANISVEEGLTNCTPLVYFFGHSTPKDNVDLYNTLVSTLAGKVTERLDRDPDTKASGVVVNTCGWIDGAGFDVLVHCVKAFAADVVLVMGQDKLYSGLVSTLGSRPDTIGVTVVKLPKSGGVVTRESTTRQRMRKNRVREYFYGRQPASLLASTSLSLYSPERRENVPLRSFAFLQVGGVQLTQGMRIIGDSSAHQDTCKLMRITPSPDLAFCVVAVLNTEGVDTKKAGSDVPQALLTANVAGFVKIISVDVASGTMTLLCPCPGALPSNYLLVGSPKLKWVEN